MTEPVVLTTWPFGKSAAETAWKMLQSGASALDSVVAGVQQVENDTEVRSVGFGSLADRIGRLTLDACVMDGKTLSCGSVAGLEYIRSPIAVARCVMEKTSHVMLVGEGAQWFALSQGFALEMPHTTESIRDWHEKHPKKIRRTSTSNSPQPSGPDDIYLFDDPDNHDTVGAIALDASGNLGGACTTAGLAYKMPGRVGDSPIIGAGLYVDNEAGAATATGIGEESIRIGASLFMVERMRSGRTPQEAAEDCCRRVIACATRRGTKPGHIAFLTLSPKGVVGAACTRTMNFHYSLGRGSGVEIRAAVEVG